MYPHRIRLRGPWECEPLVRTDGGPLPPPCRMTMPCRWSDDALGAFAGRVRFRRRFGYPGRIDPHERVWLTFAAIDRDAVLWLNGDEIGRHSGAFESFEFDITARLQPRNELVVEVDGPENGGLWGEAALEVRCPGFLNAPRLWATFDSGTVLHVATQITGAGDGLEVYVLLDGRTIFYADRLTAGTPVTPAIATPDVERWWPRGHGSARLYPVRVDLVQGGALWFAWEALFGFRELVELDSESVQINGREVRLTPLEGREGNYLGVHPAAVPVLTDAVHEHCDREGILLRQRLPSITEETGQAAAVVARLQRHACVIGWVADGPPERLREVLTAVDPNRLER